MADRKNGANTDHRNPDGTFAQGNPGRPVGARNAVTRAVEEILQGEADGLTRKAVALALDGDTTALRLCLERIAPSRKDAPVQFDLPDLDTAEDAMSAAKAVLRAVSDGEITPVEGATVMGLVESFRRALETNDLEQRITALEAAK
jgi:hypothetical protein